MSTIPAYPKGTVMIVDDTPGNLALLSDTLSEAGYRVLVATDGLAALEQINYLKPDIVLMDVVMPGMDGFETCRELKAKPETADIPVLFMTGLSELDDLLRGFSEGGLDYIVKPIRPPEVLARIEVHLMLSRDQRRAEQALSHSAFAALAVDGQGRVTWLTQAAKNVFAPVVPAIGEFLPQPMLSWVTQTINGLPLVLGQASHEYRGYPGLLANLTPCHQMDEYLLLLTKVTGAAGEWSLTSLKTTLGLTAREAEILMWISRGKTNKEIGLILDSSPRTVNKHLEHIFEKLGVTTRAAAVAKVMTLPDYR